MTFTTTTTTTPASGKGFTLVEVLVTTAILGIGITALMAGMATNSQVNSTGSEISQAVLLAQEIREWTINLPFDDLADVTYCPPRNSHGDQMSDLPDWSETITLTWRSLSNPTQIVPDDSSTLVNIQVTVKRNGQDVLTSSWLITQPADDS